MVARKNSEQIREMFREMKVCVLVPTYQNARTLLPLLNELSGYTDHVVVINDGSTDDTASILQSFPNLVSESYLPNRGKGYALRKGFALARGEGYRYAISIDSDGQHYPHDLPVFLEKLNEVGDAIVVGQRNMTQPGVPAKSSFGNRFSNFWFAVETGIVLADTQSGYRLYPLEKLTPIRFLTRKYEFEIEVMVRAAWRGVKVVGVPVSVYYPPPGQRVSHFRPWRDFTRISILNTFLTLGAIFYFWPLRLLRKVMPDKWIRKLGDFLYAPDETDATKISSVAFGLFMGIVPLWGLQLVTAILLAVLLRLNKPLVILAANISIPPMIPFILFASFKIGAVWMPGGGSTFQFSRDLTLSDISINARQYLLGSISLAVLTAVLGALLTFLFLKLTARKAATTR
jgi:glycosyltransferase involved in cell wall biosynthesis